MHRRTCHRVETNWRSDRIRLPKYDRGSRVYFGEPIGKSFCEYVGLTARPGPQSPYLLALFRQIAFACRAANTIVGDADHDDSGDDEEESIGSGARGRDKHEAPGKENKNLNKVKPELPKPKGDQKRREVWGRTSLSRMLGSRWPRRPA